MRRGAGNRLRVVAGAGNHYRVVVADSHHREGAVAEEVVDRSWFTFPFNDFGEKLNPDQTSNTLEDYRRIPGNQIPWG